MEGLPLVQRIIRTSHGPSVDAARNPEGPPDHGGQDLFVQLAKVVETLNDDEAAPKLDAEVTELTEDEALDEQERLKTRSARMPLASSSTKRSRGPPGFGGRRGR